VSVEVPPRPRRRATRLLPWFSLAIFLTGITLFLMVFVLGISLTGSPPAAVPEEYGIVVFPLTELPDVYIILGEEDFHQFPVLLEAVKYYRRTLDDFYRLDFQEFEVLDVYLNRRCYQEVSGPCLPVVQFEGSYYLLFLLAA
jgi:hypothetical protein